jgi:hypothetical protein
MKLTCQQCGKVGEFTDHKQAFLEGWDFPPECPVTTCDACPSAPLVIKKPSKPSTFKGIDAGKGLVDVGEVVTTPKKP